MNEEILISIVMPVYNSKKYMKESIDSILAQTHTNWEFIIINEKGSDDGSLEIIQEYAKNDSRFVIIQNTERLGISASMNAGIDAAKGKYVARMDADDISLPTRFEKQIECLEHNKNIAMCGTRVEIFGSMAFDWQMDFDSDLIYSNLLFYSPCVHPTIMIRKSFLDENKIRYDVNYKASEDYDLFSRIAENGKITNINEILFKYRLYGDNATYKNNDVGIRIYSDIIKRQLEKLIPTITKEECDLLSPHIGLKNTTCENIAQEFSRIDLLLKKIYFANEHSKIYDSKSLFKTLNKRFKECYEYAEKNGNKSIVDCIFKNSILSNNSLYYQKPKSCNDPLITVLLPTYNSQDYIADTLWSILNQSEKRFEVLIINEYGSNDDTVFIANSFNDPRIKIIQNDVRLGLAESLNKGMRMSSCRYIARIDADDISYPQRFEKQVKYLDENPKCGLCGGWQHHYNVNYEWTHKTRVENEDINAELLYNCDICHSTVMIRKNMFVDNGLFYDNTKIAEDWELWIRASEIMDMHNIPEIIGEYREGVNNITTEKMDKLSAESGELTAFYMKKYLNVDVPECHVPLLTGWENKFSSMNRDDKKLALKNEKSIMTEMIENNKQINRYSENSLLKAINKRWYAITNQWNGDNKIVSVKCLNEKTIFNTAVNKMKKYSIKNAIMSKIYGFWNKCKYSLTSDLKRQVDENKAMCLEIMETQKNILENQEEIIKNQKEIIKNKDQ